MKKADFLNIFLLGGVLLMELIYAPAAFGEKVENGNELALNFSYVSTNSESRKTEFQQKYAGVYVTCRYLKIIEIKKDEPKAGAITLVTVEPSSDMKIALVLTKRFSLELAGTLAVGDCVAGNGRVKSMGVDAKDLIVLDPAVLRHKDRSSPKLGKELLNETDPNAI